MIDKIQLVLAFYLEDIHLAFDSVLLTFDVPIKKMFKLFPKNIFITNSHKLIQLPSLS